MIVAIILIALVLAIVWYAMRGRAWLKTKPWMARFFAFVEPIETALYRKSETLLISRLMWVGSALVTFNDAVAVMAPSLDWTPITSRLLSGLPEDMRGFVMSGVLMLIGLLIGWLRKRTSKPIEVVAAPTTPETVAAEIKVEEANAEAVQVAKVAEAT